MRTETTVVPEPMRTLFSTCFDVELFGHDFPQGLFRTLNILGKEQADLFKRQFADTIVRETISPEQYEALTNHRFTTPKELNFWLRDLWIDIYGNEDIPGDA